MLTAVVTVTSMTIAVVVAITGDPFLLPISLTVAVDFFHHQQSLPVDHFNALA